MHGIELKDEHGRAKPGSTWACENADGEIDARTAFFAKGQRLGYQEVTRLTDGRNLELAVYGKGPALKPVLRFA